MYANLNETPVTYGEAACENVLVLNVWKNEREFIIMSVLGDFENKDEQIVLSVNYDFNHECLFQCKLL